MPRTLIGTPFTSTALAIPGQQLSLTFCLEEHFYKTEREPLCPTPYGAGKASTGGDA